VAVVERSEPTSETKAKLRERARANGEDVSAYAARLQSDAISTPSVDELLAPFRKQVEASGMTDEELDQLGEDVRREVRQEKQARKAPCDDACRL
jgi:hypothetical protein